MRCSYGSAKRDSSFRWVFSAAPTQAGRACGLHRRSCARLLTVLESRPSCAQHSDIVLPVEMAQSAASGLSRTAGHAPDDRHRSPSAACLWLQQARRAHWRVSAGGGYRLGQAPLGKGPLSPRTTRAGARQLKAIPRCSCSGRSPCAGAGPSEGGKIRAPCMI